MRREIIVNDQPVEHEVDDFIVSMGIHTCRSLESGILSVRAEGKSGRIKRIIGIRAALDISLRDAVVINNIFEESLEKKKELLEEFVKLEEQLE